MSSLKQTRRAMRGFFVNPTQLWEKVLTVAINSNQYDVGLRIRVLIDLKTRDHTDLLQLAGELSSTVYDDHATHYRMHQLSALIRKYPGLSLTGIKTPEEAALSTFNYAEAKCRGTNERLRTEFLDEGRNGQASAIHYMRQYLSYVLRNKQDVDEDGLAPTPDLSSIAELSGFTGGASLGVHGNATNLYRKLRQGANGTGWTCTAQALPYFTAALWAHAQIRELILRDEEHDLVCYDMTEFVRRVHNSVKIVSYNKIAFAPKDATTLRTVAAEPSGNTFVLKGADLLLRSCLLRAGIDLTAQNPNCLMAYLGSRDWRTDDPYCTVDLRTASGMLARLLPELLVPPEWVEVLSALRTSEYLMPDGTMGTYECFASMGNGSIFPLQTLIFASVCHAAYAERGETPDFRVYGDDIIIRRRVFDRVIFLLEYLGFEPNEKKTFADGPFRESCGADYHTGVNVRPVYLKCELDSLESIFGFHNQSLRREVYVRDYFREVRKVLRSAVPKDLRFITDYDPLIKLADRERFAFRGGIRENYDAAFWGTSEEVMASRLCFWNRNTHSWGYTVLKVKPRVDVIDEDGRDECAIYQIALLMAALSGGDSRRPFTLRYSADFEPAQENRPVAQLGALEPNSVTKKDELTRRYQRFVRHIRKGMSQSEQWHHRITRLRAVVAKAA